MNDVTFSRLLSSVMLDNKYDRFVKNRRTGKLDTRSLYKIETSSKLFKRKEARKNKNYAVSLVVDCSGSMAGDGKIKMAGDSAQKLSEHLSKIGIKHNIVTFATHVHEIKKFDTSTSKDIAEKIIGEVNHSVEYYPYLFWDENTRVKNQKNGSEMYKYLGISFTHTQRRNMQDEYSRRGIKFRIEGSSGYNSDAEALMFARKLLLKETGSKIMVFLSDGQPAPIYASFESPVNKGYSQEDFDVKHEVDITLKSGIELYSIGILSDAVNKFYPPKRTCSIREIEQLYPHIIKLIKLNLKRG